MKKAIFPLGAILALAAVSCTMENNFQDEQLKEQEITITATREGDPESRTVLESDGSVWWAPGDAISLFYGSGSNGGSKFTSNATENSKVTNFTGVITAITGGGEIAVDQTYFWGLYPYGEDASCDGTAVTMTLPGTQTAVPNTFAPNTFPSLGRSQGLIMGFYNICSGVKFTVTKEGVKKVTLKSRNGESITGKAKVSFGEDGFPVAEVTEGSDEAVLEAPEGEFFEVGKYYFLVIFPTTFSNGFTLTLETFTEEATVQKTGKITARRSNFGKITDIDANATYSQKTGGIPIEEDSFKDYLVGAHDSDGDGEISYAEAEAIETVEIRTTDIESVSGIEYMTNLKTLICKGPDAVTRASGGSGQLSSLDVSNNTGLEYLDCSNNQLTSLDVSNNPELNTLIATGNPLSEVHLSAGQTIQVMQLPESTRIVYDMGDGAGPEAFPDENFRDYIFTNFDTDGDGLLSEAECNAVTEISALTEEIESFQGIELFPNVEKITASVSTVQNYIGSGQLKYLDVSKNYALKSLSVSGNKLTSLDVSCNPSLEYLQCGSNLLTELDLTNNSELKGLVCSGNHLSGLDLSNNISLTNLDCVSCDLSTLNLSSNHNLTHLTCPYNQLSELDVSYNSKLEHLSIAHNKLVQLDLSKNKNLKLLMCMDNQLSSLDVTRNSALINLYCYENQITSLDVSKNPALTTLRCSPMDDADGNNLLETLYVGFEQSIPGITTDRNSINIPDETVIDVADFVTVMTQCLDSVYVYLCDERTLGRDLYWEQACANDIVWGKTRGFNNLATLHYDGSESPVYDVSYNIYNRIMNRCNWVIRTLQAKLSGSTPSEIETRILGEAYMLRAYSHFLIAYRHGTADLGVPFVAYETVDADYDYVHPEQQESVMKDYELIISDLQKAELLLPLFESYPATDRFHPHKASAAALMAKVYAYWATWDSSKWSDVIPCVSRLEHQYNRALSATYSELFSPDDNSGYWNSEYCWGIPSMISGTPQTFLEEKCIEFPGVCLEDKAWGMYNGWGQFKPTYDLYAEMAKDNSDGVKNDRLKVTILEYGDKIQLFGSSIRFYSGVNIEAGFMINKYMQAFAPSNAKEIGWVMNNSNWPCTRVNWPIVRFGDALLLRAEAYLATGNASAATNDLNRIRTRSNLQPLTGTATWADLYHERRCELALEMANDHAYDCKRWAFSGDPEIRALALEELNSHPTVRIYEDRMNPDSGYTIGDYADYKTPVKVWSDKDLTLPYHNKLISEFNGRLVNPPSWR